MVSTKDKEECGSTYISGYAISYSYYDYTFGYSYLKYSSNCSSWLFEGEELSLFFVYTSLFGSLFIRFLGFSSCMLDWFDRIKSFFYFFSILSLTIFGLWTSIYYLSRKIWGISDLWLSSSLSKLITCCLNFEGICCLFFSFSLLFTNLS